MAYEEFGFLTELDVKRRFSEIEEKEEREKFHREEDNELRYAQDCQYDGQESKADNTKGIKEQLRALRKLKGEDNGHGGTEGGYPCRFLPGNGCGQDAGD